MPVFSYPLHAQLMSLLLTATPVLILFVIGGGMLRRRLNPAVLPPVPLFPGAVFPNVFDWLYTSFFILFTVLGALAMLGTPPPSGLSASTLLMNVGLQFAVYLPFIIRFSLLPSPVRPHLGIGKTLLYLLTALLVIIVPAALMDHSGFNSWLMEKTGCPELQDIVVMFRDGTPARRGVIALAAVVMAPVCEEIVYRGFIYNLLKRYSSRWTAILLSALMFSVIHASLAQTAALTIFGCVQCILYDKARSLWLPITLHAVYNSITLILILVLPY